MSEEVRLTRFGKPATGGYDRVLAFIRDQLLTGRLKTGDRLLSERDLASMLGVSRPVIREVLRALAALGAIEVQRGQGAVVRSPDFGALGDFFSLVLAQHADAVDDVMEARIAIERHAIRLACVRASQADLDRLLKATERIIETIEDTEAGWSADFEFHRLIVEAAHSAVLLRVYDAISTLLQRSHAERRSVIINIEGINAFLIDHHVAVFKAIEARDSDRADLLLAEHFKIGADFRRRASLLKAGAG